MEANGHDLRPEPLEDRKKRLAKLLSRSNKALRDGIQLSEAFTGDGADSFVMRAGWPSKALSRSARIALRQRPDTGMAEDEEPEF